MSSRSKEIFPEGTVALAQEPCHSMPCAPALNPYSESGSAENSSKHLTRGAWPRKTATASGVQNVIFIFFSATFSNLVFGSHPFLIRFCSFGKEPVAHVCQSISRFLEPKLESSGTNSDSTNRTIAFPSSPDFPVIKSVGASASSSGSSRSRHAMGFKYCSPAFANEDSRGGDLGAISSGSAGAVGRVLPNMLHNSACRDLSESAVRDVLTQSPSLKSRTSLTAESGASACKQGAELGGIWEAPGDRGGTITESHTSACRFPTLVIKADSSPCNSMNTSFHWFTRFPCV